MLINGLGYFGIPTPLKKLKKKAGGGGALAETNNSTLPPVGNKPSKV